MKHPAKAWNFATSLPKVCCGKAPSKGSQKNNSMLSG